MLSVKIFTTHKFIFDTNYVINTEKYESHAPDLVIISPTIIATRPVNVDLSCYTIPRYPGNRERAEDGVGYLAKGNNGLPGQPGFNGGKFMVFTENIVNHNFLNIILAGGKGGSGQKGKIFD